MLIDLQRILYTLHTHNTGTLRRGFALSCVLIEAVFEKVMFSKLSFDCSIVTMYLLSSIQWLKLKCKIAVDLLLKFSLIYI